MTRTDIDDLLTRMIQYNSGKAFEFERQVDSLINAMGPYSIGDTAVSTMPDTKGSYFCVDTVVVDKVYKGDRANQYLDHVMIISSGNTKSGKLATNRKIIKLKPPRQLQEQDQ